MYEDIVRDFAVRSVSNLNLIQEATKNGNENAFEVTAEVSTLLSLIVFPIEKLYESIPKTPIEALIAKGWPNIQKYETIRKSLCLREFMKNMRHALAHGNIKAKQSESGDEIAGLEFWNCEPRTKKEIWRTYLSIENIKLLVHELANLIATLPIKSN